MLQRDLVGLSATAQPAMVATLARLERDALIARRPDERDGRATIVELTEKGRRVAESANPALQAGNDRALDGFSADERAALNQLLRRFIENIDNDA